MTTPNNFDTSRSLIRAQKRADRIRRREERMRAASVRNNIQPIVPVSVLDLERQVAVELPGVNRQRLRRRRRAGVRTSNR